MGKLNKYPKNRKYSEETIKNRQEKNKRLFLEKLGKTNSNFELVGPYINGNTQTLFECKKCGNKNFFEPRDLLQKYPISCPICGKRRRRTYEDLCKEIERLDPDYTLISKKEEITSKKNNHYIDTNKYGEFLHTKCQKISKIRIGKFLNEKARCSHCKTNKQYDSREFQEKLDKIYNKRFTLVGEYTGRRRKVSVKCSVCNNITEDYAYNFLTNHRCCNYCSISKAESLLMNRNVSNLKRKIQFDDLIFKNKLSYDFQINNLLLEFDGEQHFSYIPYFDASTEEFEIRKLRDACKNNYAIKNGLYLIRVLSDDLIKDNKKMDILLSSTTIESLDKEFSNILLIKDKSILLRKGKYLSMQVEYTQASGNE